jgi:hypothetical protein
MKFPIGTLVVEKKDIRPHTSYPISKVVGTLDGALLLGFWGFGYEGETKQEDFLGDKPGSRSWREGIRRFQDHELFTTNEARAEQLRLETAKSILESEFDSIQDQIQTKLEQAAKLTDEVADLLVKHNKTFEDVLQETVPLYKAQRKGGWRHSTLQCKVG